MILFITIGLGVLILVLVFLFWIAKKESEKFYEQDLRR